MGWQPPLGETRPWSCMFHMVYSFWLVVASRADGLPTSCSPCKCRPSGARDTWHHHPTVWIIQTLPPLCHPALRPMHPVLLSWPGQDPRVSPQMRNAVADAQDGAGGAGWLTENDYAWRPSVVCCEMDPTVGIRLCTGTPWCCQSLQGLSSPAWETSTVKKVSCLALRPQLVLHPLPSSPPPAIRKCIFTWIYKPQLLGSPVLATASSSTSTTKTWTRPLSKPDCSSRRHGTPFSTDTSGPPYPARMTLMRPRSCQTLAAWRPR